MSLLPKVGVKPNSYDYETNAVVAPTGFREYDARWLFGDDLNYLGVQALGLGLGTYIHEVGVKPRIVVGHDFRSYSINIKNALMLGLQQAGCEVLDIGLALSPIAYFGQFDLDKVQALLEKLSPVAEEKNATLAQLVLRWTTLQKGITVVLAGARNAKQAISNAQAMNIVLSADELQAIDGLAGSFKL